ncbi:MAG: YceI family protein [Myxococcota bacterium]|nr:YceI family protein [Myxococcota bacterium]
MLRSLKVLILSISLLGSTLGVAAADEYTLDPIHSAVMFKVLHNGTAFTHGMFTKLSGALTLGATPAEHTIKVEVDASSVFTNQRKRDQHLRSPDFFNASEFPTLSFVSTRWEAKGEDRFHVTGQLTMRGVTKEVTIPVRKTGMGRNRKGKVLVGFEGSFSVKRSDYGISWGIPMPAADQVFLTISVEGVQR